MQAGGKHPVLQLTPRSMRWPEAVRPSYKDTSGTISAEAGTASEPSALQAAEGAQREPCDRAGGPAQPAGLCQVHVPQPVHRPPRGG